MDSKKLLEEEKKVKLQEGKIKVDLSVKERDNIKATEEQVNQRLTIFLDKHKDNQILQEYISLMETKQEVLDSIKKSNEEMYEVTMDLFDNGIAKEEIDELLSGSVYDRLTLKLPYTKKQIRSKEFLEDFKPDTEMYQKYVEEKTIKGNIVVTPLKQ